jgi:hypothetical protein
MELAAEGNLVYFLNPPGYGRFAAPFHWTVKETQQNLLVIDYTLPSPVYTLRFKARPVHDYFIKKTLIKHLNAIAEFDELWCFEPNVFSDFKSFNAKKKLLFIVDYYDNKSLKKLATEADAIATISSHIFDYFDFSTRPRLLLHHGLNKNFSTYAERKLHSDLLFSAPSVINVGYVGNLLQGDRVDRDTFRLMVEQHPNVIFHIYGPSDEQGNSLGVTIHSRLREFLQFLRESKNVKLHGIKEQTELAREIQEMDIFLTCYNYLTDYNKSSNCHKVIEYLSTGKVVVSNKLFAYEGVPELVVMPSELTNENLPSLLTSVIENLEYYNSPEKQKARISFALGNTYKEHVKTLGKFIEASHH